MAPSRGAHDQDTPPRDGVMRLVGQFAGELTAREREVLVLVGEGLGNHEIARRLGVSKNTVRFHLKQIHGRLCTDGDRRRLVALAQRMAIRRNG